MTILIAFDCDGTLDSSDGPIPTSKLHDLNAFPYIQIVIVSPSPFCVQLPFPRFVSGDTRLENLLAASLAYPASLNIYVSDNPGDDITAKNAGFIYVHPKDFSLPLM
jgi:FMN phosphatase YigB (HAD superfamily)